MKKLLTLTLSIFLGAFFLIGNTYHQENCDKVIYGEDHECTCISIETYDKKGPIN